MNIKELLIRFTLDNRPVIKISDLDILFPNYADEITFYIINWYANGYIQLNPTYQAYYVTRNGVDYFNRILNL